MIKSTVKFLLLLSLAAVFVFLYQTNGFVNIRWRGVSTSMHIGTFAVVAVFLFWVFYYIMSILSYLSMVTNNVSNFWKNRKKEEGERLVEEAFSDLAAGMPEVAFRKINKAMDYVDSPFALWGYVQSVQQMGQIPREKNVTKLLGSKHMSFLGHRFRIEYHLKAREDDLTLEAAENAKKVMPHSPWLLKVLFDAYIKKVSYEKALDVAYTLAALGQRGAKNKLSLVHYLIAGTQEEKEHKITNLQKAHDYDPSNILVASELAQLYLKTDKLRKAIHVIEIAWKVAQHPSLTRLYAQCHSGLTSPEQISAMLRLLDLAPNSIEGYVALVESCIRVEMHQGYFGINGLFPEFFLSHTEQIIIQYLDENLETLVKNYQDELDLYNHEKANKKELVGVYINIHTYRAVCKTCRATLIRAIESPTRGMGKLLAEQKERNPNFKTGMLVSSTINHQGAHSTDHDTYYNKLSTVDDLESVRFIQKTLNPITIKNSESVKSSLSIVKKNSNSCCEKKVVANKPHRK